MADFNQQRHTFKALDQTFVIDATWNYTGKPLGAGAYGCVIAATHKRTGDGCAIKKITNINTKVSSMISFFERLVVDTVPENLDETMLAGNQVGRIPRREAS